MMNLFRSLAGSVRLRYLSADTAALLGELEKRGIPVFDVTAVDELTLEFIVSEKDRKKIEGLARKRGERLTVIKRCGLLWPLVAVLHRPLVVTGILLLLIIGIILPKRILFVSVEGNEQIPERKILEATQAAGLGFGADRQKVRSEQIKNQLLQEIPELKWAGVNTYGSRAVVTVRERDKEKERVETYPVRHIVAARDGIVVSGTVMSGSNNYLVGQAVKSGDILISGYTDCGITIRADAAQGQIMAATNRKLKVLTPSVWLLRREKSQMRTRFSLQLGKKRINFYKGSGISGARCVKMSTEYVLRLPGGFELPVALIKEAVEDYHLFLAETSDPQQMLESFAAGYLNAQMVFGSVQKKEEILLESEGTWILEGDYACIEDIGIPMDEKNGEFHGKTDGTDRER